MAADTIDAYLPDVEPALRPVADRIISAVRTQRSFDVAIEWRQLTFAVGNGFDHWICEVAVDALPHLQQR